MEQDKYHKKYSAAQKMKMLKSQQAKLEVRTMPEHSQLKLKAYDKKAKTKRKKITKQKSRKVKQLLDAADSSSSSRSKISLASTGDSIALPASESHKSDVQLKEKDEENALKWKQRTKYLYEAERISIKLKEISAECEKDNELRVSMDDIVTRIDTLKKARDEYYQYVQAQNDIFDKQIKLLDETQTVQLSELTNKVHRLKETLEIIDVKLSTVKTKLQNVTNRQAQKAFMQNFFETIRSIF